MRQGIIREYVMADLYYQTLNVKTVEEEPVYTVMRLVIIIFLVLVVYHGDIFQTSSLVSALGGAFSLYLGIAIILLFELLELAVQITLKLWKTSSKAT